MPRHGCKRDLLLALNIFLHLLLIDLTVKDSLVRILHLVLIHSLLLNLLGGLRASLLLAHSVGLFDLLLLFLLLQSEIGHVFRVDVGLLVESSTLCG